MLAVQAVTGNPRILSTAEENLRVTDLEGALSLSGEQDGCLSLRVACPGCDPASCRDRLQTPRAGEESGGSGCRAAPTRWN